MDAVEDVRLRALEVLEGLGPDGVATAQRVRAERRGADAAASQAIDLKMVNDDLN